jgi:hypothetical protein
MWSTGLSFEYSGDRIIPMAGVDGRVAMGADVQDIDRTGVWLRSSRCSPDWNCVEVGRGGAGVIIRDSKGKIALRALDSVQWTALLAHCRAVR